MDQKTALISPIQFVRTMEKHWTENLENVSSEALRRVWQQLATTFGRHILAHQNPEQAKQWTVLQPPTGSGKTQGTIVYCSILSRQAGDNHPGVLIVTRFKVQADIIAEKINELSGMKAAVAYHSGTKSQIPIDQLEMWPVLVITHRAYELALDHLGAEGTIQKTWPFFHAFNGNGSFGSIGGTRKLVVIDECLDIVEHSQTDLDGLRQTLGAIPNEVCKKFNREIQFIEGIVALMQSMEVEAGKLRSEGYEVRQTPIYGDIDDFAVEKLRKLVGKDRLKDFQLPDLTELRRELRDNVRFDQQILCRTDNQENQRLKAIHDQRLKSLHFLFRGWAYYSDLNNKPSMNTARLLVPEDVKGAVVLDATASSNVLYEVFEQAEVVKPPLGSRSYRNVTMHISRGHRLGKHYLRANHKKLTPELIADLEAKLKGRSVLIVCHKDVEPALSAYSPNFKMHTAHWGMVDGSNEWKDCDTVVIYGLPYLPDEWSANVFMACQGFQDWPWFASQDRPFKKHMDIRQALKTGQMVVSVVQAINRARCRKVIDDQGNCPTTDVYLLLPPGRLAEEILKGIRHEMPGVNIVEDWELVKTKRKPRRSNHEVALIKHLQYMEPGRYSKNSIAKELGIPCQDHGSNS